MPIKREFYFRRLFLSFIISTAVFSAVFFAADLVSFFNYRNTAAQNIFIQHALADFEKRSANLTCDDASLRESLAQLDHVGSYIALLERRFSKTDARVVREKKLYNLLQLRHFGIIKALNARCDFRFETIIFFYSNSEALLDASKHMGGIIGAFKERDAKRFMVYSFDTSIEDITADSLARFYNATRVPVVIAHEQEQLYPDNIDDLIMYFS